MRRQAIGCQLSAVSFLRRLHVLIGMALFLSTLGAPSLAHAQGEPPAGVSGAVAQDVTVDRTYLAQPSSNAVFVLASGSMELLHILRVPSSPAGLVVDARHHLLYVAADNAGVISVYDDRTYRLARRYGVGGHPAGLSLAGQGQRLLITDDADGSLRALGLSGSYQPPAQLFTLGSPTMPLAIFAPRSAWSGGEALAWGQGFTPGEPVTLSWGVQQVAHDVANAVGIAMVQFRVPRGTDLGDHLVILQGARSGKSESGLLRVVPAPPAPPPARHDKRSVTRPKVSLLQMALGPSVTIPLALPGSHPAATARGTRALHKTGAPRTGAASLRVPLVALPVVLLFIALALFKMGRGRRRAKARAKTAKAAPVGGKGGAAKAARPAPPLKKAS